MFILEGKYNQLNPLGNIEGIASAIENNNCYVGLKSVLRTSLSDIAEADELSEPEFTNHTYHMVYILIHFFSFGNK